MYLSTQVTRHTPVLWLSYTFASASCFICSIPVVLLVLLLYLYSTGTGRTFLAAVSINKINVGSCFLFFAFYFCFFAGASSQRFARMFHRQFVFCPLHVFRRGTEFYVSLLAENKLRSALSYHIIGIGDPKTKPIHPNCWSRTFCKENQQLSQKNPRQLYLFNYSNSVLHQKKRSVYFSVYCDQ